MEKILHPNDEIHKSPRINNDSLDVVAKKKKSKEKENKGKLP